MLALGALFIVGTQVRPWKLNWALVAEVVLMKGVAEGLFQVEYVITRHARGACMEGWTMLTTLRNKMV